MTTKAVPVRADVGTEANVLLPPFIVLFVKVCVCASNTRVSFPVRTGSVTVLSAARFPTAKTY